MSPLRGWLGLVAFLLVAGASLLPPHMASVAAAPLTFIVTTTDDTPTDANCAVVGCTLRQAVSASNANDPGAGNHNSITFASGVTGLIVLRNDANHGTLTLNQNAAITGPSAATLAVDGNNHQFQLFNISGGITASISGITIQNGDSNGSLCNGGGGLCNGGILTLTQVVIQNNTGNGGGIYNGGTLTVIDSTISENTSRLYGGGIFNGSGSVMLMNTTMSGNHANLGGFGGGAIFNGSSTATLTNSTITGNSADNGSGGGIFNSGTMNLTNVTLDEQLGKQHRWYTQLRYSNRCYSSEFYLRWKRWWI